MELLEGETEEKARADALKDAADQVKALMAVQKPPLESFVVDQEYAGKLVETGESKALSNGSAVFSDLADGMYTVQLQEILPPETSSDVGIAGQTYIRSHRIAVQAGDHVVIACDDVDCTGIA